MQLLQPYQPHWKEDFRRISMVLADALLPLQLQAEHVGSTAVPGLAAKPIIDIDIVLDNGKDLGEVITKLELAGYYHNGDQGIPGREVFKRSGRQPLHPVLDVVAHHLYVCPPDSAELQRHLAFRDYLIANEEARHRYEDLKQELAAEAGQDRKIYAALKEIRAAGFIQEILERTGCVS